MKTKKEIALLDNEYWWGGVVRHGDCMPYGPRSCCREELYMNLAGNQGAPLLVSSAGRYVWCDEPFSFEFKNGVLIIDDALAEVDIGEGCESLRGAYRAACAKHFPPSGVIPHEKAFTAPQYNAWIDMHRFPTQEKVLSYAREIVDTGMPPGVLIIDDFWHINNGVWEWDSAAFPSPKEMVDQLHAMGFLVMVWICPFVTPDNRRYWELKQKEMLLRNPVPDPKDPKNTAVVKWWNGYSALLDLSNPQTFAWFQKQLDRLVDEYGIDGFKFDGGDPYSYRGLDEMGRAPRTPNGHSEDFGRVGLRYRLSEYRACWKLGGQHLIQRVRDKAHAWGENGMADLLPTGLAQGLVGYAYTCPDMVGGGEVEIQTDFDQELFIRWAQMATFWPIIQYTQLPSRVLDEDHQKLCRNIVALRMRLAPEILELARHAAQTGEPILRHMAYEFPGENMEHVDDQFMLGDRYLVAPVLKKGDRSRTVRLPAGRWLDETGGVFEGACAQQIAVPLERIPWFTRDVRA